VRPVAVVMCHNDGRRAERLRDALSEAFEVAVFDSGSDEEEVPSGAERFPNIYWTRIWNEALRRFGGRDAIWVLCSDIELTAPASDYLEAMGSAMPFGCWSPAIEGRSLDFMKASRTAGKACSVLSLEGMCMGVSREGAAAVGKLPSRNRVGWGMDHLMSWRCRKDGMRNVLDGRVVVRHSEACGYDDRLALMEMYHTMSEEEGPHWREVIGSSSDWFRDNVLRKGLAGSRVSVVVASYNQRRTLPLTLASLAGQTATPMEVVVADDGSTDGTLEWLDTCRPEWPFPARYVTRRHGGYDLVGVNNAALPWLRGDRVLFTNGDVVLSPESVEAHADVDDVAVGGGFVTGVSHPASESVREGDVRDFGRLRSLSARNPPDMTNEEWFHQGPGGNFYGVWGGNYSVPRSLLLAMGGFNGSYRLLYGGEEADTIQRVIAAGGSVGWVRRAEAYHLEHSPKSYRKRALGNVKYKQEHLI